eukprot:NODE_501_length_2146_cov_9.052997_g464_i0.p1 GENE.NODE_501_length_2146_cov_9.052997_g464_i0~~NODE_501_length_2146_cov_9.052997_g464_i0.p1  ORF type:complete len:565 (-),score=144.01 NODE_501_length_2146_cov_9.052997_g464_i0:122-1816(-)
MFAHMGGVQVMQAVGLHLFSSGCQELKVWSIEDLMCVFVFPLAATAFCHLGNVFACGTDSTIVLWQLHPTDPRIYERLWPSPGEARHSVHHHHALSQLHVKEERDRMAMGSTEEEARAHVICVWENAAVAILTEIRHLQGRGPTPPRCWWEAGSPQQDTDRFGVWGLTSFPLPDMPGIVGVASFGVYLVVASEVQVVLLDMHHHRLAATMRPTLPTDRDAEVGLIFCLATTTHTLITGHEDGTLLRWCLDTHTTTAVLPAGHGDTVWALVCPNSSVVISASADAHVAVTHLEHCTLLQTLTHHTGGVLCVRMVGARLVSGSEDTLLCVWHQAPLGGFMGKPSVLSKHTDCVNGLQALDPRRVVSAGGDGLVAVWDVVTSSCLHAWQAHATSIATIGTLGDFLLSIGYDSTLRLWSLRCPFLDAMLAELPWAGKQLACISAPHTVFAADHPRGRLSMFTLFHNISGQPPADAHNGEAGTAMDHPADCSHASVLLAEQYGRQALMLDQQATRAQLLPPPAPVQDVPDFLPILTSALHTGPSAEAPCQTQRPRIHWFDPHRHTPSAD